MKLGSLLFAVVVILVGVAIDANGQKVSENDELLNLDRQWQEAVVAGDVKFIEKRTAEDFVFTHGGSVASTYGQ